MVETKSKGLISIKDLKIGDVVAVGHNQYDMVYSFGHYQENVMAEYLVLNHGLEISPLHLILLRGRGFVPASTVSVGDYVSMMMTPGKDGSNTWERIESIQTKSAKGAYAPFTRSGTILVSNVLASCFVTMQAESSDLLVVAGGLSTTGLGWHKIAHAFEFPHRMYCHLLDCSAETYTDDGLSSWLVVPFKMTVWILQKSETSIVMSLLLLVIAVMLLALSTAAEYLIRLTATSGIGMLFTVLLAYAVAHRRASMLPRKVW